MDRGILQNGNLRRATTESEESSSFYNEDVLSNNSQSEGSKEWVVFSPGNSANDDGLHSFHSSSDLLLDHTVEAISAILRGDDQEPLSLPKHDGNGSFLLDETSAPSSLTERVNEWRLNQLGTSPTGLSWGITDADNKYNSTASIVDSLFNELNRSLTPTLVHPGTSGEAGASTTTASLVWRAAAQVFDDIKELIGMDEQIMEILLGEAFVDSETQELRAMNGRNTGNKTRASSFSWLRRYFFSLSSSSSPSATSAHQYVSESPSRATSRPASTQDDTETISNFWEASSSASLVDAW